MKQPVVNKFIPTLAEVRSLSVLICRQGVTPAKGETSLNRFILTQTIKTTCMPFIIKTKDGSGVVRRLIQIDDMVIHWSSIPEHKPMEFASKKEAELEIINYLNHPHSGDVWIEQV